MLVVEGLAASDHRRDLRARDGGVVRVAENIGPLRVKSGLNLAEESFRMAADSAGESLTGSNFPPGPSW